MIADLSHIWILADIYEYELPFISVGQEATVTLTYDPRTVLKARASFIYPTLDPQTRTAKVRFTLENPHEKLKPDMYANVELKIPLGTRLAIPRDAILESGERHVIFIHHGGGKLEWRNVKLGVQAGDWVEVVEGLKEGDQIVTSANFLIDSGKPVESGGGRHGWDEALMVGRIIEFSARNRFIVFLLVFGLAAAGLWAMKNTPVDAVPDLSDTQVIIYTTWMGRSPDLVEDQITYPIITALLSAPKVTVVRGFSDFGYSYVYVLFKDGTDIYWARSRVLEYLSQLAGRLPAGVSPQLGPDATAVGWVFQYALVDEGGQQDLASLRSFQDWSLRYWLRSVEGVAEVASVGGFVRQYQINLDPTKVQAYKLSLPEIIEKSG